MPWRPNNQPALKHFIEQKLKAHPNQLEMRLGLFQFYLDQWKFSRIVVDCSIGWPFSFAGLN